MNAPEPYPLRWPEDLPRTKSRTGDPFRVGLDQARKDLIREVNLFGGKTPVISSDWAPFSDSAPKDPGVALWFQWKNQWRCIACDTYARFVANVRAVGNTVEALRSMERYGTQMLDQLMTGALSLPAPAAGWWVILGVPPNATVDQVEDAYRRLAMQRHPDHGGSHDAMAELNAAHIAARRSLGA